METLAYLTGPPVVPFPRWSRAASSSNPAKVSTGRGVSGAQQNGEGQLAFGIVE